MTRTKIYDFPKTFKPKNLFEEMLNAEDGQVFILDQRSIPQQEGDDVTELTIAVIQKVREE